jgi:hypothetical protein
MQKKANNGQSRHLAEGHTIVDDVSEHPGPNVRRIAAAKHVGRSNKGVLDDQLQYHYCLQQMQGLRPQHCARWVDPVSGCSKCKSVIISLSPTSFKDEGK